MGTNGIDLNRTFGQTFGQQPSNDSADDKPKAQLWLNAGYEAKAADGTDMFVALPGGMAIDTMNEVAIRGQNANYNQFVAARNQLLADIIAAGGDLKPGESRIVNLQLQLRRVNDAPVAPAVDATNPFARSAAI